MKQPVFVISAPSGTGKNTLIELLMRDDPVLAHSISTTTRPPRPNEKEGEHYYFISSEEFRRRADGGEFAEWARVLDNFYGTEKKELQRLASAGLTPVLDIDIQGAVQLKESLPEAVLIFIAPPDLPELERRLRQRGTENEEQIKRRMELAEKELLEAGKFDHRVINDDLHRAVAELREIISRYRS